MTHALVRGIPRTYARATVLVASAEPIDVARAEVQHRAYVAALSALGVAVLVLPVDDGSPDSCFVEDTAVIAGSRALITRLGAPSRVGEERAVRAALGAHLEVAEMGSGGTIDGGDVLVVGRVIVVGRSRRTDATGARRVREVFEPLGYEVRTTAVGALLHLKCACSRLDDETVLVSGEVPVAAFAGLRTIRVAPEESCAANVVAVGRAVLVAAGHPRTEQAVRAAGFETHPLEVSEIRKGDGALTCLSLRF
jgi:dimethylargininase